MNSLLIKPDAAERAILGALIRKPTLVREISEVLRANDFAERSNREIYAAVGTMQSRGDDIDLITLDAELSRRKAEFAAADLVEITSDVPAGIEHAWRAYADIVLEASERRRLAAIGSRLAEASADPDSDIGELIAKARESIAAIKRVRSDWVEASQVMLNAYTDIEERSRGKVMPCISGVTKLDTKITGFFPGELIIVGARPSVGKTAFGLHCAISSSLKGFRVCVASGEMTDIQLGSRLFSDLARVNGARLRKATDVQDADWADMSKALADSTAIPCRFLFTRELEEIVAQTRTAHERGQCDMLVVDYAQLLTVRRRFEADRLRIGHISKELKSLAVELKIPVILLAQVGRQEGKPQMPTLSELKGSGSLEEDADGVILMHRIDNTEDKALEANEIDKYVALTRAGHKTIIFSIAKNRQGATGRVLTAFDAAHMRFITIS